MKIFLRKAAACLLAVTFFNVPVVAEEEAKALYIAPFVSSEQLSYTCKKLVDDFENGTESWEVSDGAEAVLTDGGACGMSCMSVSYTDEATVSTSFEKLNFTSSDGVCAVIKTDSESGVRLEVSVRAGNTVHTSYGVVPSGGWYCVSADIREMKNADRVDGITVKASGGHFLLDYVHSSSVYAPVGAVKNLTDEYYGSYLTVDSSEDLLTLICNGRNCEVETGRIDRLLKDGENALCVTLDNGAGASEMTVRYSEEFGTFKSKFSHTQDILDGVGTYIVPLDGIEQIEGFKLQFESKPKGDIKIIDISLTSYAENPPVGECYTDGETITVSYEDEDVPDGCPVYLYRMMMTDTETGFPYMSNLNGETSFSFPVDDGEKNNLLYKYKVMYDREGELVTVCSELTVANPEECAPSGAFVETESKKGVLGEFYRGAGTVMLQIDPHAFISDKETKYSYKMGDDTFYIHTDSAEYLDKRVAGISLSGGAVYICVPPPESVGELENETSLYKYSAVIGYIASKYSGGENGTVNGFVVGNGLAYRGNMTETLEFYKCVFDVVYFSSRAENSKSKVILSVDGALGASAYGFTAAMVKLCPYISDIMLFCDGEAQNICDKAGLDARLLVEAAEGITAREFGLFVYAQGYDEPYGELVRDFYLLYPNTSFECFVLSRAEAANSGNVFEYMDTSFSEKYVGELCEKVGLESWSELCDVSLFSETVRENAPAYLSYGKDLSDSNRIFSSTEGGKWLKGVGCATVSADDEYISVSLDNTQTGSAFVIFEPDVSVTVQNRTVSVKLKVDYLQADEKTAEVFLCAVYGDKTVYSAADVKADTETVISFDVEDVRKMEKLMIGVNGSGTPRLCISEGYVSAEGAAEDVGEETSAAPETSDEDVEQTEENGYTRTALIAVVGILSAFGLTGAVMYLLNRRGKKN